MKRKHLILFKINEYYTRNFIECFQFESRRNWKDHRMFLSEYGSPNQNRLGFFNIKDRQELSYLEVTGQ